MRLIRNQSNDLAIERHSDQFAIGEGCEVDQLAAGHRCVEIVKDNVAGRPTCPEASRAEVPEHVGPLRRDRRPRYTSPPVIEQPEIVPWCP